MRSGQNQGLVQTVLGPVPPSELGPTTTHEHGYGHILENIVPKMRRKGFSEETVRAITLDNPARILALV